MSQLIQMRRRINAIKTIKKITHAMRLISMSTHTRLKIKKDSLDYYNSKLIDIFNKIKTFNTSWTNKILNPINTSGASSLIILIGSQKGLCGNFNTNLLYLFKKNLKEIKKQNTKIITIGKKTSEYLEIKNIKIFKKFDDFTSKTIITIADNITDIIINSDKPFRSVICYSNYPKNFFIQKQKKNVLIPFNPKITKPTSKYLEEYIWEETPKEILNFLSKLSLNSSIQKILMNSLLAEQAARFIAMDHSTRNAENLLETMTLEYNKTRQAKITKELTDLSSSFLKIIAD